MKRIAMCLVALLALSAGARAASVLCVSVPGLALLVDPLGNAVIPGGAFDDVFTVREGALYAAGSRGNYRLFDAGGRRLGDVAFEMIDDAGDGLVFRAAGLYGAMDASGDVVLEARWTQLTADGAGGWLALDGDPLDEQPDEILHLDAGGVARRTGTFTASGLARLADGRMPFMDADGLYGAVDAGGEVAVEAVWQYVGGFEEGVAKVTGPAGMGAIDTGGRAVIPPVYAWLERGEAMIAAWDGDGVDVFGRGGGACRFRVPGPVTEVALAGAYLAVGREGETCVYDADGARVAELPAGATCAPGSRGQLIAVEGAWGEACQRLLNPDGSAASGAYQQLLPLCPSRYAFLEMEGTAYYSAELDRVQRSWDYANRRYGLLDDGGRELLPARYREIRALDEEYLLLVGDGAAWLADRNGRVITRWAITETEGPTASAGG